MNKFTEDFIRRLKNDLEVTRIDARNLEIVGGNTYYLDIMPDGWIHFVEIACDYIREDYTMHELEVLNWIQDAESAWEWYTTQTA